MAGGNDPRGALRLLLLVLLLGIALRLVWTHTTVQVVVARYGEDLGWLRRPPFDQFTDVIVYDKSDRGDPGTGNPPPYATVVKMPNVGRESHTYLAHIVNNWDRLADVTVFVMGSCAATDIKWQRARWVAKHAAATKASAFPDDRLDAPLHEKLGDFEIETHQSTDPTNARLNPESTMLRCPDRPLRAWLHANRLGPADGAVYTGVFAASRDLIKQHPRERYERLLRYVDHHSNPEAGHYLERSWMAVFHPVPPSCRWSAAPPEERDDK